jgi:hypothetical protein
MKKQKGNKTHVLRNMNRCNQNKALRFIENLYKSMGFGRFLSLDKEWCAALPEMIFSTWKKSKGHNANMLNPEITKVGMSIQIQTKGEVGSYGYNLDCILVGK